MHRRGVDQLADDTVSGSLVEGVGEFDLLPLVERVGELAVAGAVLGARSLPSPGG